MFEWLAARLDHVPGSGKRLFFAGLAVVAVVTALLNLDTAVVFLTPVMIGAAARRGLDQQPFLYGTSFMANASSLFLPGSNLTNLIVIGNEHVTGSEFARRMLPAALGAVLATAAAVWFLHRGRIGGGRLQAVRVARPGAIGIAGTLGVVVAMLILRDPALPVLGLGLGLVGLLVAGGRLEWREAWDAVNPAVLAALFSVAVALGTLARIWSGPADLLASAGRVETALVGAAAAVTVNNLPAAALLSAGPLDHASALLIGLNVGPNLAMSGSLSAFLWLQTARRAGAAPSIVRYTKLGVLVAPAGIAGALLALYLLAPARL
jgi:arsenical pump membrane protein